MDGFNVIPVDKETFKNAPVGSGINVAQAQSFESSIEVVDEEKEKAKLVAAGKYVWVFILSIVCLVGAMGYFVFLVIYRIDMLSQISNLAEQMKTIGQNIDVNEMQEFQAMDKTLKVINGKLGKHVLNSQILVVVNQNIRNTLQVSEYRLEVREKEVEVNLAVVSPSFKELAEQTERLYELREGGAIKSFSVSNLSFESETRRLKFSIRLIFDKSKVVATSNQSQL